MRCNHLLGRHHYQTQGNDAACVEPGAEHPGAVQVDPETLDVGVGEADGGEDQGGQDTDAHLGGDAAAGGGGD